MSKYQIVRMGKFLKHRSEFLTIDDFQEYKRARVQLHGRGIIQRDAVTGSQIRTKKQQAAKSGEFLVAEIDAKVGGFGIVPFELDGAIVSSHYFLFEIDESICLKEWLDYYVRGGLLTEQVTARGSTNYAAIRPHHVLDFEIPLPVPAEQRRIVGRIEELAGKVEEARRLRAAAAGEIDHLVTSLHLKLSQDHLCRLDELIELYEDRVPVTDGQEYPQVGIRGFGQGLYAKESITSQDTSYKWFNRLFTGAIVLSQPKGWEGAIAGCDEQLDGWFVSPEYRTFRCLRGKAHPKYLAKLFRNPWFWNQLKDVQRGLGGRRQRTRPEQFLSMEVVIPTFEKQEQAIAIFDRLDSLKPLQDYTSKRMEAIMPIILDKAFKGEL